MGRSALNIALATVGTTIRSALASLGHIVPQGDVYKAGTLSGNPRAMQAGLAQLRFLKANKPHERLAGITTMLSKGIEEIGEKLSVPLHLAHVPGMLSFFFTGKPVTNFAEAQL